MKKPGKPAIPAGHRVYAIGDIHGSLDLLTRLQTMIAADMDPDMQTWIVYLGDYVDRGPDSNKVLDAIQAPLGPACNLVWLLGNHEKLLLDFATGDLSSVRHWLKYGGDATLHAYGVAAPDPEKASAADLEQAHRALQAAMPPAHKDFLKRMPPVWTFGDYMFVHAGIRPGIALEKQDINDLIWIRKDFLNSDLDHGKVIVHGHTVSRDIDMHPNRIGVDTGAVWSGCLTAVVLEGHGQRYLQTARPTG